MPYNLVEAGAATGKGKSTILKAIKRGAISATRDTNGGWLIEPAELHRVYRPVSPGMSHDTSDNHLGHRDTAEMRELRARLDDAQETIRDLRHRLDAEAEERRRLTALLADRTNPTRWRWRRG